MKNLRVMSYAVLGAAVLARRVVRYMKAYDLHPRQRCGGREPQRDL